MFIFLLFLLVPAVLFMTGIVDIWKVAEGHNFAFGTGSSASDSSVNNATTLDTTRNTFNLNFQINQNLEKNITVQKISENKTTVSIA